MTRDMTESQFLAALERHGMKIESMSFFGYVLMPDGRTRISRLNGGERRRDQLAYLLREWERIQSDRAKCLIPARDSRT